MTPIQLPSYPGFLSSNFYLRANTFTFESPFSRTTQRIKSSPGLWMATYVLPAMDRETAGVWQAFFLKLEGQLNEFYAFDPENKKTIGTGAGDPLVNGASQTGSSLVTNGWSADQLVLAPGEYFEVGGELKQVTDNIYSDGSGNATITFQPAIRTIPADGAGITTKANGTPTCRMFVTSDTAGNFMTTRTSYSQSMTFSAMESVT